MRWVLQVWDQSTVLNLEAVRDIRKDLRKELIRKDQERKDQEKEDQEKEDQGRELVVEDVNYIPINLILNFILFK